MAGPLVCTILSLVFHYGKMHTIFGNIMSMGKFSKDSNYPLGIEDADNENEDMDANGVGGVNEMVKVMSLALLLIVGLHHHQARQRK